MPARTNATAVKLIISTTLSEAQIAAFITAASQIIDANLADKGLSSDLLQTIETWLAAHLLSMRDQRVQARSIGDVSFSYQGHTGLGLDGTTYGQQVKLLDASGTLAALGRQRASLVVLSEYD